MRRTIRHFARRECPASLLPDRETPDDPTRGDETERADERQLREADEHEPVHARNRHVQRQRRRESSTKRDTKGHQERGEATHVRRSEDRCRARMRAASEIRYEDNARLASEVRKGRAAFRAHADVVDYRVCQPLGPGNLESRRCTLRYGANCG